jgi:hypothetical protein
LGDGRIGPGDQDGDPALSAAGNILPTWCHEYGMGEVVTRWDSEIGV